MIGDRIRLLAVGALVGTSFLAGSRAADLVGLDVQEDADRGLATLVLTFQSEVPDLEVDHDTSGIRIRLPSTRIAVTPPPDAGNVRVVAGDGASEVTAASPDARLETVRVRGSVVTIRWSLPVADGAAMSYLLGVGDVVAVSVYRDADLSGDFPVLQDGTILMPLIGAVPAAGTTESDLASRIREMLAVYLVDPQVRAGVKEYRSQFVIVTGDVDKASRVALHPRMTLKGVLSEAGVALKEGREVTLTRTGEEPMRLNADELDEPGVPSPKGGDVLTVEAQDYVFISGEVRSPGRYDYIPALTLQQALTFAGGLTEWASKKEILIQRQAGADRTHEVVNLRKVESHKVPDPQLEPGDLVLVRRKVL